MTNQVFIFGAGPQGRVILDILRTSPVVEIGGFLDDRSDLAGREVSGLPVFNPAEWLSLGDHTAAVVVAIGNNVSRMAVGERVLAAGCRLHTAIHSSAAIARDVEIGQGTVVCMQAAVGTGCRLGTNVVVNTGSTLDHDSIVEDGAYLSPGVHSAGEVRIGVNAFIGAGAILLPGVRIGRNAVIGAGSVVLDDVPAQSLSFGTPARLRRVVDDDLDWSTILGGRRR